MKNKIYVIGLVSLMILSLGCMFKIMHWPGAGIILFLGIVLLSIVFIPSAFISNFKTETKKSQKWLYIVAAVVLAINLVAALFKIQHWPGAGLLLILSTPLSFILILPMYIYYKRKEAELDYRNFLAVVFFFAYFAAISALLSLSASKNIVNGYVNTSIGIEQQTHAMTDYCREIIEKDSATMVKMSEVSAMADNLCFQADNLVTKLLKVQTGHYDDLLEPDGKVNLWKIEHKDGGIGEWIMEDLAILKPGIKEYYTALSKIKAVNSNNPAKFDAILTIGETNGYEWEKQFIKDKIIVSCIEKLYLLKHQVRLAEWQALSSLKIF